MQFGIKPQFSVPGKVDFHKGFNQIRQNVNPLVNLISVPTNPIFRGGKPDAPQFGAGTYGDYGNWTKTLQRMGRHGETGQGAHRTIGPQASGLPQRSGSILPGLPNLSQETVGALNTNTNNIASQEFDRSRIGLLRQPVTTEAPQLQLTGQLGGAKQLRDLEQLSNLYLSNFFTGHNLGGQNLINLIRFINNVGN